jgi:hypothetical protein
MNYMLLILPVHQIYRILTVGVRGPRYTYPYPIRAGHDDRIYSIPHSSAHQVETIQDDTSDASPKGRTVGGSVGICHQPYTIREKASETHASLRFE